MFARSGGLATTTNAPASPSNYPGTHYITQQSKLGVLPKKALQPPVAESPRDARGVSEKSRHDNVHEAIADEPSRRGVQDPASIPNAEVSLSGVVADQDTLGGETDYGRVESTGKPNHTAGKIEALS